MDGLDCAGLVIRVYADVLGIALPDNVGDTGYDCLNEIYAARIVNEHRRLFKRVVEPTQLDLILFWRLGTPSHIGIFLDWPRFLHASNGVGVVCERLTDRRWSRRIEGYYRYG